MSTPTTDSERRRQRRVKVKLPVRLNFNNNEALAITNNISLLGTSINTNKQILPGTRVALSLEVPKYTGDSNLACEVKAEGAIVRCDAVEQEGQPVSYEVGVFFSSFLPSCEEKLFSYMDYVAKEEEKAVHQWVEQYRAHIKKRKAEIAKKKMALARKRKARLAKRAKKLAEKQRRQEERARKRLEKQKNAK